jgi:hypothetical protein
MITCYLRYIIDPYKIQEFEEYAKMWIPLVNRTNGVMEQMGSGLEI